MASGRITAPELAAKYSIALYRIVVRHSVSHIADAMLIAGPHSGEAYGCNSQEPRSIVRNERRFWTFV